MGMQQRVAHFRFVIGFLPVIYVKLFIAIWMTKRTTLLNTKRNGQAILTLFYKEKMQALSMQFMTIEYISFVDEFYAEKQSFLFGDLFC